MLIQLKRRRLNGSSSGGGSRPLDAMFGKEAMADDFGLLFEAVAGERLSRLQHIGIAAERMAH